jgi:hypothetical protein
LGRRKLSRDREGAVLAIGRHDESCANLRDIRHPAASQADVWLAELR